MNKKIHGLKKGLKPFIKYSFVGITGTMIDISVFYFFNKILSFELYLSGTIAFLLAVINNFTLNRIWTFKNTSKNTRKLFIKFVIVSCIGLILTLLSLYFLVKIFKIDSVYAKIMTSGIVVIWNFLGNKYWTFSIKPRNINIPEQFIYDLSIIIPSYNEEKRLKKTILDIQEYFSRKAVKNEIIIVNDGSSDSTITLIQDLAENTKNLKLIDLKKNQGKGFAVKKGIEKALGKYILVTDADSSTPIEEYGKLIHSLEQGFDIGIGSRYLKKSKIKIRQPFHRIMIGRIGNFFIQLFLVNDIKDTQCGFKLFRHEVAKDLFSRQKIDRWGFDMEILAIAQLLDYKIVEVPVSWYNSSDSRLRPVRDALKTFLELIYIKLNLWSGRYK